MIVSVPQTDTGGWGEYPQANETIFVQELGKKADVPSVYVLPRVIGVAATDPLPTV